MGNFKWYFLHFDFSNQNKLASIKNKFFIIKYKLENKFYKVKKERLYNDESNKKIRKSRA